MTAPRAPSRIAAALMMIALLLFCEFAVASYVCPAVDAATTGVHSARAMHGGDCPQLNVEQSSLCEAHCEPDSQSAHTVQVPPVRAFIAAALTVVIVAADTVLFVRAREGRAPILERITAPPLAIRHCCFRI